MHPKRIDHVAFWVEDRDGIAEAILALLPWHVVDRQDTFTLLGGDARGFKLTLFDAEGPRERGAIVHVALRGPREENIDAGEGICIRVLEVPGDYDLDHVALRTPDPVATAIEYERYGFRHTGEGRAEVGGAYVELRAGSARKTDRPLLNHLAVLVDSADDHVADAEELGIEVESVVDAANTYAAFLWGPERVRIEYVEHKPSFSLT